MDMAQSIPGADIGSDHDLVMMSVRLRLKKIKMQGPTRVKFDLEKLKDTQVADTFQAMIGDKFAPLTLLDVDDTEVDTLVNTFNKAMTETASEILGKRRAVKRPWVTTGTQIYGKNEEHWRRGGTRQQKVQESTEQLNKKLTRA